MNSTATTWIPIVLRNAARSKLSTLEGDNNKVR